MTPTQKTAPNEAKILQVVYGRTSTPTKPQLSTIHAVINYIHNSTEGYKSGTQDQLFCINLPVHRQTGLKMYLLLVLEQPRYLKERRKIRTHHLRICQC